MKTAWGLIPIACMLLLTAIFPPYGLLVGIWDMGQDGPRKTQGAAVFGFALLAGFVWAIVLLAGV